jgi:hypothetical protein
MARKTALPVGCEEPQRIPPLTAPRIRDLATLEHDVVDGAIGEEAARREAGVPGPDDDRRDALDGWIPQTTSTVTFTGLVMAS